MRPGVRWSSGRADVSAWAPHVETLDVVRVDDGTIVPLTRHSDGWFTTADTGLTPGDRYLMRLDGSVERPDPASLSQPDGVHGPSEVVDLSYPWSDGVWDNPELADHVFYELHVGAFSAEGTFEGVARHLDHLVALGVTAIELMPVAQFPGERNWGYDGVDLYAAQNSYGGARGLQRLVDRAHRAGLAVFLDVVYNHLGPEGNYLREFGPYFTDRYATPWGEAVNLDGPESDHVRRFLIENALMWIDDFHMDGLRLDAIHALYDQSAHPFLLELSETVHRRAAALGRRVQVIAENAGNDPRALRPWSKGGLELDGAWNDDFHHALHVLLTGESARYYADFENSLSDLETAISDGYVNNGRFSPYRNRRHGAPSTDLPRSSLVVFAQNHDQVGNRAAGERLSDLVDPARLRFAAAATLLSPWVPLLFMGEEWAESRPFLYFVDHGDEALLEAVRRGRTEEFAGFFVHGEPAPDPADPETFQRSQLDWDGIDEPSHASMLRLHRELLAVRRDNRCLRDPRPGSHSVDRTGPTLTVRSAGDDGEVVVVLNAGDEPAGVELPDGAWKRLIDGSEEHVGGKGASSPESVEGGRVDLGRWGFAVYRRVG